MFFQKASVSAVLQGVASTGVDGANKKVYATKTSGSHLLPSCSLLRLVFLIIIESKS